MISTIRSIEIFKLLVVFSILAFILGCDYAPENELICKNHTLSDVNGTIVLLSPNNYLIALTKVSRNNSCIVGNYDEKATYISDSYSFNVKEIASDCPYILGYGDAKDIDLTSSYACEGYFIINTESKEIFEGLKYEEWLDKLKQLNLDEPKLRKVRD